MPNPVLNLRASPNSTSSLEVRWSYPQGAQTHYKYVVFGPQINLTAVETNSTVIKSLNPGTKYTIKVKTIAAAECESTEEQTDAYTSKSRDSHPLHLFPWSFGSLEHSALLAAVPQAVTNLTVTGVEATAVRLAWLRQTDFQPSYYYLVAARQAGVVVQNDTIANETYTFLNLGPGESYNFDVFAVVGGVKSDVKSISSDTSRTRPGFVTD